MNLNLRETPTRQLIERRDELMAQVDAINREVQLRAREQMERQRQLQADRLNEQMRATSLLPTFSGAFGHPAPRG